MMAAAPGQATQADAPDSGLVVTSGPEISAQEADTQGLQIARSLSTDSGPTSREIVKSSRRNAIPLLGAVRVPTSGLSAGQEAWYAADVYLEVFTGAFRDSGASVPPGATGPGGRYLILVTDAHLGRVTSLATGPDRPSEQQLQSVGAPQQMG